MRTNADLNDDISGHDMFSDSLAVCWRDSMRWMNTVSRALKYCPNEIIYRKGVGYEWVNIGEISKDYIPLHWRDGRWTMDREGRTMVLSDGDTGLHCTIREAEYV